MDEHDDDYYDWLEWLEWRSGGAREWDDPQPGGDR
jgi:phage baseplate assembly protein gpV